MIYCLFACILLLVAYRVWSRRFLRCPICGRNSHTIKRRRMNTAYENDELNFLESCEECYEYSETCWAEQWAEYYAGRL